LIFLTAKRQIAYLRIILFLLVIALIINSPKIIKTIFPLAYWDIISLQAQENNIDPYLIAAVIKTESNFRPRAVSPEGARGLMQIMPQTGEAVAREIGEKNFTSEQLFDPKTNILLGTRYLADLNHEFQNNTVLALAAYNGGLGNVKKWLAETGSIEADNIERIPFPETKYFVQSVMWNQKVYRFLYGGNKKLPAIF